VSLILMFGQILWSRQKC